MKRFLKLVFVLIPLSGCVSMQVAGEVQSGRRALQRGEPKVALGHFETVARLNPDYATDFTLLHVGISTYVGRTYYEMGDLKRAAANLERARTMGHNDVARLYYGLVLAKTERVPAGLKEMEAGLEGLGDFLERLPNRFPEGKYWDVGGSLRKSIAQNLQMIRGKEIDRTLLLANVEWVGKKIDDEIDEAKHLRQIDPQVVGDDGGKGE